MLVLRHVQQLRERHSLSERTGYQTVAIVFEKIPQKKLTGRGLQIQETDTKIYRNYNISHWFRED